MLPMPATRPAARPRKRLVRQDRAVVKPARPPASRGWVVTRKAEASQDQRAHSPDQTAQKSFRVVTTPAGVPARPTGALAQPARVPSNPHRPAARAERTAPGLVRTWTVTNM